MSFLAYLRQQLPEAAQWILYEGLDYRSEREIYDTILQLEQELLGPLHKAGKKDVPVFKLGLRLKNILYQAGEADYMIQRLTERLAMEREEKEFYKQRLAQMQTLLSRFETLEDMERGGVLESGMLRIRRMMAEKRDAEIKAAKELNDNK